MKLLKLPAADKFFSLKVFDRILGDSVLNRKQKGERLLVEMRVLRYPYYTRKSKDFSSYWGQLGLDPFIQAKKSAFLERGCLEIALSAASLEEFKEKVSLLYQTLESPVWKKIWES
jgi:hypothetical protein